MEPRALFEILVREHVESVRAFLLSAVRDLAAAEDLLQEAFIVAWKNLHRYDRELPFGPWVRGIAGKLVLNHRRRAARSKLWFCDAEALGALDRGFTSLQALPGDTLDERLDALRDCMVVLTESQRTVIDFHYQHGLSCKAIAVRTGIGVEAVKKHLQRGRQALQRCLEHKIHAAQVSA